MSFQHNRGILNLVLLCADSCMLLFHPVWNHHHCCCLSFCFCLLFYLLLHPDAASKISDCCLLMSLSQCCCPLPSPLLLLLKFLLIVVVALPSAAAPLAPNCCFQLSPTGTANTTIVIVPSIFADCCFTFFPLTLPLSLSTLVIITAFAIDFSLLPELVIVDCSCSTFWF